MEKLKLEKFGKDSWLSDGENANVKAGRRSAITYCATKCKDDGEGNISCEDTSMDW
jgi:hypothetical protein